MSFIDNSHTQFDVKTNNVPLSHKCNSAYDVQNYAGYSTIFVDAIQLILTIIV